MGLRDFWDRMTCADKVERVEEELDSALEFAYSDELEEDRVEEPTRIEDYEAMKDDRVLDERFRGSDFDADRDL